MGNRSETVGVSDPHRRAETRKAAEVKPDPESQEQNRRWEVIEHYRALRDLPQGRMFQYGDY